MSNAEIRNLALDVLGLGESLASSAIPRDTPISLGYNSKGLASLIILPTLRQFLEALLGSNEITSTPRPLSTADLGVTVNGTVIVEGTIRRDVNALDIYIFSLFAKNHSGSVVMQGLNVAIDRARSMGLDNVRITGPVGDNRLKTFLYSIPAIHPGSRVYGQSGVGVATTTIEIPVR